MAELPGGSLFGIASRQEESQQAEGAGYPEKELEHEVAFSDYLAEAPPSGIRFEHLAAGLASAFTSTIDNPFFKLPTKQDEQAGALPAAFAVYAPYYVGTGLTAEQIAYDIAFRAAQFLQALEVDHGYDGYVSRMMAVLRRGEIADRGLQAVEDRNILFDVHDFLAGITTRLHRIAPLTVVKGRLYSPAEAYREETHRRVDPYVQTVVYEAEGDHLDERFKLPEFVRSDPSDVVELGWDLFDSRTLKRGAEFAALAAEKVGDPVVREALQEHYVPPHIRRREYLEMAR